MKNDQRQQLNVIVLSPYETFYEGMANSVSAVNKIGPFDVLPGHINFMSLLSRGAVKLNTPSGERIFKLERGILKVHDNQVKVFVNV